MNKHILGKTEALYTADSCIKTHRRTGKDERIDLWWFLRTFIMRSPEYWSDSECNVGYIEVVCV